MKVGWESLPILPLRCVLEHLTIRDAMAVMSVCRNWRNAMLVYEGYKELLELKAKELEKNMFLARLYKKHVRRLHIRIDCTGEDLDKFFHIVMPEFLDSLKLKEIVFIGQSYLQPNYKLPATSVNRIVTESLVFKNSHCLTRFAMLGCKMEVANDNDRYTHEQVEYYSTPLSWSELPSPGDSVLSCTNTSLMVYSTLQSIAVDYDQISTEALETLSHLPMFSSLSLTITSKHQSALEPIDWDRLAPCYPNGIDVSVNIIGFSASLFDELMENVFVEGLSLVSLKVFFCRVLHSAFLAHVVQLHKATLRALVWVDAPHPHPTARLLHFTHHHAEIDACNINPLILLCWQCVNLRRLVVHGYWIWQYDVLGFVRLRKTLQHLEISAMFSKHRRVAGDAELLPDSVIRVCSGDQPARPDNSVLQEMSSFTERAWCPTAWARLHPALTSRGTAHDRARYVLQEMLHTMDEM